MLIYFSGGGHTSNPKLNRFGPSLRWMSYEAILHGLKLEAHQGDWKPLNRTSSMTLGYKILECLPVRHLSYKGPDKTVFGWVTSFYESNVPCILFVDILSSWHLQKPRIMKAGQLVHSTVFGEERYTPKARTHGEIAWNKDAMKHLIEDDPYTNVSNILRKLEQGGGLADQDINVINTSTTTGKLILYCNHYSISKKCYSVQKSGRDLSLSTPTGLMSL